MNDFEEYIRQSEPHKREKGYAWQTAIGLQAVDGLKTSDYLIQTARQHIEGDITKPRNSSIAIISRGASEPMWKTARKRRTKFLHVLPKFYRKRHLASHRWNISVSTAGCLRAFSAMLAVSETTI